MSEVIQSTALSKALRCVGHFEFTMEKAYVFSTLSLC